MDALENLLDRSFLKLIPDAIMSVSEWAGKYRYMSQSETSRPGPWRNEIVPYLADIMDALNREGVEKIIFLKPTQVGGTECGINILGYLIDQNPSHVIYVLPDDDTLKEFSADRLRKVLQSNECFIGKYQDTDSKNTMLRFNGGFIKFGSARSPMDLASWSIPIVIMDEIDKYPKMSGKEASPLKLAEERTKNWPGKRKMFFWSTPTLKTGQIYQLYESADVRYEYQVPCPFCGSMQPLKFEQVKFDATQPPTAIESNTYYECCNCHEHITDRYKPSMLCAGKWVPLNEVTGKVRSIAYGLNSLYSPWVTFGQMAAEFIRSKDDPLMLMNFVNSWLGEPWESKSAVMEADIVLQHKTDCPMFIVPEWAQLLTAGVDVQKGYLYYEITAWGPGVTSQVLGYGRVLAFEELEKVMDTWWPDADGNPKLQVAVYGIDSGYRTEEVYDYCGQHPRIAIPVKGSSSLMTVRARPSNIERKDKFNKQPLQLWIINTDIYKDELAYRLKIPVGKKGACMLNADCEKEYAEQITSEQKIVETKNGRTVETWQKKTSAKQNHWLDCKVYAFAVADLVHMRSLQDNTLEDIPLAESDSGNEILKPKFTI